MSKTKFAMVVHGGAGEDSDFIREHEREYRDGLINALKAGCEILKKNGDAIDAVEAAVKALEDNPLFNAGRGSALTEAATVEMCASIMGGKDYRAGAAAIVKNVKNPVVLARKILEGNEEIYIGSDGAQKYAEEQKIEIMPDAYFITEHQYDALEKAKHAAGEKMDHVFKKQHGTVGAVALDRHGNMAAATSTGGLENTREDRIGDSSMIGVSTYADHRSCAVSCSGDGEHLIKGVIAHDVAANVEYRGYPVKEAARFVIFEKHRDVKSDIGVIAVSPNSEIAIEFNSERMHRAWMVEGEEMRAAIWKDEDGEQ